MKGMFQKKGEEMVKDLQMKYQDLQQKQSGGTLAPIEIEKQAAAMAPRIPEGSVGIDPATIITIFTAVLPALIDCLHRNDDVDATTVAQRVADLNAKNPKRLLKRVASNVRKEARREGQHVSKEESYKMAHAIIDQTLFSTPEEVASLASNYIPLISDGT